MQKTSFKIRAHHLLCIQGFQGLGYSAGFVENLQKIINHIQEYPKQTELILTDDLDDICQACPHSGTAECEKDPQADAQIKAMDRAVLKKLDLDTGIKDSYEHLVELSNAKLTTRDDVSNLLSQR